MDNWKEEIERNEEEIEIVTAERDEKLAQIDEEMEEIREQYRQEEKHVDESVYNEVQNLRIAVADDKENKSRLEIHKGRIEGYIETYEDDLKKIAGWKDMLGKLDKLVGTKVKEIEERNVIDQFLKDLPTWELENLAPAIMLHANDLLSEFYDSSWSIKIQTLTPKKTGGYKEDFKITIIKNEIPRDFDMLSGGQKIMLESVLRQAIKLARGSKHIKTTFCDESDGAFDSENATTYYNMLDYVHRIGDVYHTFIITHRKELISNLDQQIILKNNEISCKC